MKIDKIELFSIVSIVYILRHLFHVLSALHSTYLFSRPEVDHKLHHTSSIFASIP
jgi:hypothetical protein